MREIAAVEEKLGRKFGELFERSVRGKIHFPFQRDNDLRTTALHDVRQQTDV